jgi:cold shock CspA family protein
MCDVVGSGSDVPQSEIGNGPGGGPGGAQRFGRIVDRQPSGSGPEGRMGTYFVRDDETGTIYAFSYADIVTEGFRTIRTGERVRFLADPGNAGHAAYVIRLDLPDVEDLYR